MLFPILKTAVKKGIPGRWIDAEARQTVRARPRDDVAFSDPHAALDQMLAHELVSFDLFDTVVRRRMALDLVHARTADFADQFLRGDNGPLPRGLIARARHRLQAEVKARTIANSGGARNEVDLTDVFDTALAPFLSNPVARARAVKGLIAQEVGTEKAVLSVDPAMREVIGQLRRAGRKVILISDMYLQGEHVEELLDALGLRPLFDHVFVSASTGVTKASGAMFAHVDSVLGLAGVARLHVGDNLHGDVWQPRQMGWDALHYHNPAQEERREAAQIRAGLGTAHHPRAFRALTQTYPVRGAQGFERLTAAAFSAFARQVLSRAVQGSYDRVLFLTRDGTRFRRAIEAQLQDQLAGAATSCPPMADMAFSRRAGVLLGYPEMDQPGWHQFLADNVWWLHHTPLSIRTIMRCFSIAVEELPGLAPALGTEVEGYLAGDDPATDLGFDGLLARPDLLEPLHAALAAKRDRVRAYLESLGLFDRDERILLVDIGYSGTALIAISEHMFARERIGQPVRARLDLMLLAANRYHRANLGRMHPRATLLPGVLIGTEHWRHRAAATNFGWLEPFAVDRSRGSLRDYRADASGRLQPVFAPAEDDAIHGALAARMEGFAAEYARALLLAELPAEEADRRMLELWISEVLHPSRATVEEIRMLCHHGGLAEVTSQPVLARIRLWAPVPDILRCIADDRWLQGSLRQSGLQFMIPFANRIAAAESR